MGEYGTTRNWWPSGNQWSPYYNRSPPSVISDSDSKEKIDDTTSSVEPANWLQKFSIVAVVSLIAASLIVAITVPITLGKGPQPADVNIVLQVRIMDDYQAALSNPSSTAFKNYQSSVCLTMAPVLSSTTTVGANYVKDTCQVLQFQNGSVIARLKATFYINDQTKTSVLAIQNQLYQTLSTQAANNTLAQNVDPKYFLTYTTLQTDPCADPTKNTCDQVCVPQAGGGVSCSCFNGYFWNGGSCQGQDICGLKLDNCDKKTTTCVNDKYSTFKCSCNTGYKQISGVTNMCTDIDECSLSFPVCNANTSVCNNTVGSYFCTCLPGYQMNSILPNICDDIDECSSQTDYCDYTTTKCINTAGSYSCACRPGFQNYANYYCSDIDECALQTSSCNLNTSTCNNTFGSYWCDCLRPGFMRGTDMLTCIDVNECTYQSDFCDVYSQNCYNSIGNYSCLCKNGYQLNVTSNTCVDTNECLNATYTCPSATCSNCVSRNCVNNPGSYYCNCMSGFTETPISGQIACQDVDECMMNQGICDVSVSYCNNTIGNYGCLCKYPATGTDRFLFPADPKTGCLRGEYGFTVSMVSGSAGSLVVYNSMASVNRGFNLGSSTVSQITIPVNNVTWYWIHQSLASSTGSIFAKVYGAAIGLYSLNGKFDMTSVSGTINVTQSSTAIQTSITSGTPTSLSFSDTSLTAFNIQGVFSGPGTQTVLSSPFYYTSYAIPTSTGNPTFISITAYTLGLNSSQIQLLQGNQVVMEIHYDRQDVLESESVTAACILPSPSSAVKVYFVSGNVSSLIASSFAYAPLDTRYTSVLWCVYRSSPLSANVATAVIFDDISIPGQAGLLLPNSQVQAPVTGDYYIDITVLTVANQPLLIWVAVNGVAKFGIKRDNIYTPTTGMVGLTRNRASLVTLNKGDIVSVMMTGQLFGSYSRVTSFSGFLLYAH